MDDLRDMLTAKAAAVIPGERYNAYRLEHQHEDSGQVLHFEDVLAEHEPRRALVERIVPSLARFLHRKKQDPAHPGRVVVALFLGDSCFVLSADDVVGLYCELEGTDRQAFHSRTQKWGA